MMIIGSQDGRWQKATAGNLVVIWKSGFTKRIMLKARAEFPIKIITESSHIMIDCQCANGSNFETSKKIKQTNISPIIACLYVSLNLFM